MLVTLDPSIQHNSFLNFYLFILFLAALEFALRGISSVAVSRGYSPVAVLRLPLQWRLLLQSMRSRHAGFSSCSVQAQQLQLAVSRAKAQLL